MAALAGHRLGHARALGEQLSERLDAWMRRFPRIGQHRGLGPMRAIELVKDRATKEPDKPSAAALVKWNYEHGLITLACGTAACAVGVAVWRLGLAEGAVAIRLPGGTRQIDRDSRGHILMTGPAATSFTGMIDGAWLAAARG